MLNSLIFFSALLLSFYSFIGLPSQYKFDPQVLHRISKRAIAASEFNSTKLIDLTVRYTREHYKDLILPEPEWIFNNAGGAMGSMLVLHASLSEYLIIFGSPIGTEGHTGRFAADDYFHILFGEQWAFKAGSLQREVYKAGDQHHLKRGEAKAYRIPNECWALEYARGNIPLMLPFGLMDTLFSTLDFISFAKTVKVSAQSIVGNLMNGKI